MFTNGLNYWTKTIKHSQANPPFIITNVALSNNNQNLIVYYSPMSTDTIVQLRTFRLNKEHEYEQYTHAIMSPLINHKNMTLDADGNLYEIVVDRVTNQRSMNNPLHNIFVDRNGQKLNLRIPDVLINDAIFEKGNRLERMMQSNDGRLLMCGKLLIKLNARFDEIELIGCIFGKKKQQQNSYVFLSLTNCEDKALIDRKLKSHP
jgi:hypothetical protein